MTAAEAKPTFKETDEKADVGDLAARFATPIATDEKVNPDIRSETAFSEPPPVEIISRKRG